MSEYGKTENLFKRDEETHKLTTELRLPEFDQISKWLVTEKIDGTNIRLELLYSDRGWWSDVRGRSDNATLPKNFAAEALPLGGHDLTARLILALEALMPDREDNLWAMTVYGEGYGPGIQKGGGLYTDKKSLVIFDVVTYRVRDRVKENEISGSLHSAADDRFVRGAPLWRTWDDVEAVASILGIPTVPLMMKDAPLDVVVEEVKRGFASYVDGASADLVPEGVVARTDPYLFNYRGQRVMFKLKGKDLPDGFGG